MNKSRETDLTGFHLGTKAPLEPKTDLSRPAVFRSDRTFLFYFLSFLPASGLTCTYVADSGGKQLGGEPMFL